MTEVKVVEGENTRAVLSLRSAQSTIICNPYLGQVGDHPYFPFPITSQAKNHEQEVTIRCQSTPNYELLYGIIHYEILNMWGIMRGYGIQKGARSLSVSVVLMVHVHGPATTGSVMCDEQPPLAIRILRCTS